MRKIFALMLLLSLITMLTGCVDSERYWTLPLEDGFEVWCENGERMLVRETDTFRYAFVVRGIEALRVEDNFILTRSGGESYTFVETATGAVARTASGEDGFRAACEALGLDADGAWMSLDSRPEAAAGAWHQPLRRHHAPAAGRGNVRVRGIRGGRTARRRTAACT